jgi:hypothetical protein
VVGVLASSVLHRENLVRSMITGTKRGSAAEAISGPRRLVAALLLGAIAAAWVPALVDRGPGADRGDRIAAVAAGGGPARERD